MIEIFSATTATDYQHVRELISEYVAWDSAQIQRLGLDVQLLLDFYHHRGNEPIPGPFAPPEGCLLLATDSGNVAGCGAFQKLAPGICELKRMFVRPAFRGRQIGRDLAVQLIAQAREAGYQRMRLDTVSFMEAALKLYTALGFRPCQPYYKVPEAFREITVFRELDLTSPASGQSREFQANQK